MRNDLQKDLKTVPKIIIINLPNDEKPEYDDENSYATIYSIFLDEMTSIKIRETGCELNTSLLDYKVQEIHEAYLDALRMPLRFTSSHQDVLLPSNLTLQ